MLLTLFVSMQLLSGVHRHEEVMSATIDCMECAHHVHHPGHFAASDIHIEVSEKESLVRIRTDGMLRDIQHTKGFC